MREFYNEHYRKVKQSQDCERKYQPENPNQTVRQFLVERAEDELEALQTASPLGSSKISEYADPKAYGVWLDGRRVRNSVLVGSSKIYRFLPPSKLYPNAQDYGQYTYHLTLMSEGGRQSKIEELSTRLEQLRGD